MSVSSPVWVDAAGVRLRALLDGDATDRPVLFLHGFTGSAESMESAAHAVGPGRRAIRLELVGHGESEAPTEVASYTMEACIEQVAAVVEGLALGRPHLVGYSMGGRAALAAAVADPTRFASLTLIGATAGIDEAAGRAERMAADEALADRIERFGLEAFVDHWMSLPIFASQARLGEAFLARARAERLRQRPHGLALSLRGMGAGAQKPIFDRLSACALPTLLVVGEEDAKFQAIAERLAVSIPEATIATLAGVGHAAHIEAPEPFGRRLRGFLDEVEARATGAGGGET